MARELGHPQPPTSLQPYTTTALRFLNKNLQPKVTKSTNTKNSRLEIEKHKNNPDVTGQQDLKMMHIMSQRIYVRHTTKKRGPGF